MTKRKTAPKPAAETREVISAETLHAEGPPPDRGGAWIRHADGSLTRDGDHEQSIPDDEGASPLPADVQQPQPPAPVPPAEDIADQAQEG